MIREPSHEAKGQVYRISSGSSAKWIKPQLTRLVEDAPTGPTSHQDRPLEQQFGALARAEASLT